MATPICKWTTRRVFTLNIPVDSSVVTDILFCCNTILFTTIFLISFTMWYLEFAHDFCECRPWPKQDHLGPATHYRVMCLYLACLSWLLITVWRIWPIFVLCFYVTCKHFYHTVHLILLHPLWVWHLCINEFLFQSCEVFWPVTAFTTHTHFFVAQLKSYMIPTSSFMSKMVPTCTGL